MVPMSKAFADKINFMQEWATQNAKPASTGQSFEKIKVDGKVSFTKRNIKMPVRGSKGLDG